MLYMIYLLLYVVVCVEENGFLIVLLFIPFHQIFEAFLGLEAVFNN